MNNQTQDPFAGAEIISVYTLNDSIEDDFTVDANSGDFGEVSKNYFKFPVYMTRALFDLIERAVKNPRWMNDYKGVWSDVCYMSVMAAGRQRAASDTVTFEVIITGAGQTKYHALKAVCGGKSPSDPQPIITFMLASED